MFQAHFKGSYSAFVFLVENQILGALLLLQLFLSNQDFIDVSYDRPTRALVVRLLKFNILTI